MDTPLHRRAAALEGLSFDELLGLLSNLEGSRVEVHDPLGLPLIVEARTEDAA